MGSIVKFGAAAALSLGALAFATSAASAKIVCNGAGDCWHVTTDYNYAPEARVVVHPDDWKWKDGENFHWREHAGRGYWNGDNWKEF
jgi:hypothetical protein